MAPPARNHFEKDGQTAASPLSHGMPSSHVAGGQRLIWCHEHCHNTENRERRQVIRRSMSEISWSCTFHKKVLQFSKWLEELPRNSMEQYVLVLGWREAQPCLRLLGQQHRSKLPLMAVVVCNNKKQQTRAEVFLQSLPSAVSMIHTCVQDDIPDWLFNGRIRRCFGVSQLDESSAKYGSAAGNNTSGSESETDSQKSWETPLSSHALAAPCLAARTAAPAPSLLGLACPPGFEDVAPAAILTKTSLASEALALLAASTLGQPLPETSWSFNMAAALDLLNSDFPTKMPQPHCHYQQEVPASWNRPVQAQVWHL
eukprot:CAMPEP_0178418050 /NCGR_PEP_ID=MMETSP0689_2-20121128/24887_1 /TAXON_ID=160604 /ORGANISM="Amphidinium massartii, Strain CS-259" /LENGTH=313 /DNA_ID=CAMNT_0020039429 /DNA_START=21 /DNA_END=962 /DNA_ORIENTATION=+